MFERFEQVKVGAFKLRKRALDVMGDSLNNVADNIHYNRTYSISETIFSSREITAVQELRSKFNDLKKSETYSSYIMNCLEFFAYLRIFEQNLPSYEIFRDTLYIDGAFETQDDEVSVTFTYKILEAILGYRS